jgi:hypothetical protein
MGGSIACVGGSIACVGGSIACVGGSSVGGSGVLSGSSIGWVGWLPSPNSALSVGLRVRCARLKGVSASSAASGLRFAGIEGMDKAKRKPEPRESEALLNIISLRSVALGMEHVRIVLCIVLRELRSISLPAGVVGAKPRTY